MIVRNYLGGRTALLRGDVNLTGGNIKALLVKTGSSFMTDDNVEFLSDFSALTEFASGSYARVALTGYVITPDWDRDRAIYSADDPLFPLLDDDLDPIVGMILYMHVGADSANIPLYAYQLNTPVNPGSLNYTFMFNAAGIAEL